MTETERPSATPPGQRVSDEQLATIIAWIQDEDARAVKALEAHGNYGEEFGAVLRDARAENAALRSELEQERVRLAGCGVVAMCDTPESAVNRPTPGDYGWSASADDVARRVDECIALRERVARLREALVQEAMQRGRSSFASYWWCWLCDEQAAQWEQVKHAPTCPLAESVENSNEHR